MNLCSYCETVNTEPEPIHAACVEKAVVERRLRRVIAAAAIWGGMVGADARGYHREDAIDQADALLAELDATPDPGKGGPPGR